MRILLAEDEKSLSKALTTILEYNHYSVDAVYNGDDAYLYLITGNYDLAILDIMMPKKDGITVLKEFRKVNKTMPILILSAKSEVEDKILGLDYGADDYLAKPFDTNELLARLRTLLRRKSVMFDTIINFSDISLNTKTFEISSTKGTIRLNNKEFQVLHLLMTYNKVISTEELMTKIWGYDSESDINVVWTHISYIRKKLALLSDKVTIKAIRNLGYQLVIQDV